MAATNKAARVDVSLVIPLLDEAENVDPLLEEILAQSWVKDLGDRLEIVCVDDGSGDETLARLRDWLPRESRLRVLGMEPNQRGKSRALTAGFRVAAGSRLLIMDGDRQNDPADLSKLLAGLDEFDVVSGVRGGERKGVWRQWMSWIGNTTRNRVLGENWRDVGCGLKAFRREALHELPSFDGVHRFYLSLARMHGLRVCEVDVRDRARVAGVAKYGAARARATFWDLLAVRWYRSRRLDSRPRYDSGS